MNSKLGGRSKLVFFLLALTTLLLMLLDESNISILSSNFVQPALEIMASSDFKEDFDEEINENCSYGLEDLYWTRNISTFEAPDCDKLLTMETPSTLKLDLWQPNASHTTTSIQELLRDCRLLRKTFPIAPLSVEESEFPLAYVFVGERNADQTLRLFRMLYWPQNTYCFTYDGKSAGDYKDFMLQLARCFPDNVMVNPNPIHVNWGEDTVLRNVVPCLEMLAASPRPWRYLQIVSYNDFPLKTNLETVRILKILNGSNDCELSSPNIQWFFRSYLYRQKKWGALKPIPPGGLVLYKGSYSTTMTREFVQFQLQNPIAQQLLEWTNDTWCPEEQYWSTLVHNPLLGAPGSFPGACLSYYQQDKRSKGFISRCQIWAYQPLGGHSCRGQNVHFSCVYGVDDVSFLLLRPELVAHKFYNEYQPASLYCMEKWHYNKTCSREAPFVESSSFYYSTLAGVRYQNMENKDLFIC